MAVLKVENLSCGYGGDDVVKNVSFTVNEGETAAVAGPNGCGKTTLLRALCGLIPLRSGSVFAGNENLADKPQKERARKIAVLSQTGAGGGYFGYTVMDTVLMGRYARQKGKIFSEVSSADREAAEKYIDRVGMKGCENCLITELSGGQLQRVLLARAFAQETDILLLDEPANHLDIKSQIELAKLLRGFAKTGKSVIGVFHDISFAAMVSDKIMLMRDGEKVMYEAASEVIRSEKLSEVFEADVRGYMKNISELWND